ncbi:CPBP family intramembrane glutamic endopeptidase [uncultured Mycolicibacterium sp.]|uniref:Rv0804 family intramembrane glutamic endopeptidase n=1 Tax=uncultured Mycolicibacterium sp. TaxID=2320817 RepID=UPI00261EF131|nr:CPBP family intramembrane glutamic endopeptidase [uncultured Mycolicibacterium sp.]
MNRRTIERAGALGLAALLVGWNASAVLPYRWRHHPLTKAAVGTALAAATAAPLGLRPPGLCAGLRWGAAAAGVVAAGVAATTAVPPVADAMADRQLPETLWRWGMYEIPLGTVWAEEVAFRGALSSLAARAFGPVGGRLLQAVAFGLSHVVDARGNGEPVAGTVLVTGAAGWVFDWLRARSGSVLAPLLAHLAVNEAGAVAAVAVQRRRAARGVRK